MHGAATQLRIGARENSSNHTRYGGTAEQGLMLSASAFKLSARFSSFPTKLFTSKVICRHPSSPRLCGSNGSASIAWPGVAQNQTVSSSLTSVFNCHSSSCLLAKHGVIGASIWHALLPSSCLFVDSARKVIVGNSIKSGVAALGSPGREGIARGFIDGSWNVAGDARPARWLHNSTWLLFGFCSCFSAAATSTASTLAVACCEADVSSKFLPSESEVQDAETPGSHGKQVFTDFSVIGIPGDGRCLFRAVAHGVCLKQGTSTSDENSQRELADDLRSKVVDELIKRRSESEWFIEGDFDQYTERMREPHVWGGEPELLMLSHVLKEPITVYMSDRSSNGLIAIAEYGQEYGKENPIQVLYHGFGHYDALQIPGAAAAHSRL